MRVAVRKAWTSGRFARACGLGGLLTLSACTLVEDTEPDPARIPDGAGQVAVDAPQSTMSADDAAVMDDAACGSARGEGGIVTNGSGNTINVDGRWSATCEMLRGNGKLVDTTRTVGHFTELVVSERFVVALRRADQRVRLIMDENLLPHVLTRVEREVLTIASARPRLELFPSAEARVHVAAPELRRITATGAAHVGGEIAGSTLAVLASGSADVALGLRVAQALAVDATGAASLHLSGEAAKLVVAAGGAATLASNVVTSEAEVVATGAARLTIFAAQRVVVRASGSASVLVRGRPMARDVETSGSASVVYQD